MTEIEKKFKNPPVSFRGAPFWSWNGRLEKNELLRQIDNLKAMGMGGYFCHSRTGLITEYLGDEWFELINACTDHGTEQGMETWLYDEDRWPSGTAGGMVTQNPEYRIHYIRLTIISPGESFSFTHETIAAFTVDLDGLSFKNKNRIYSTEEADGRYVLLFTDEEMSSHSFYNGYTYVDTMNKEATEEYIRITHAKYTEKCGDRIGTKIKGIFTDEPHRGALMCGFALPNENPNYLTPFPKGLFDHFFKAYGFDLRDFLPELFLQKDGEKLHPIKWQYTELLQTLFIDNFFKPISKWCKENNMKLTGHVLHEDRLSCQVATIGSVIRAYEYFDSPGVDILGEHNYQYWIVKQLQSAARQLGKKQLLSELYGCTGWQMSFESHKAVGDWQALFGINLRCHHLSWYTMLGEAKRDYPASISHQSAWFKDYNYIENYYSRIHVLMGLGEPVCKLLVVNPVESIWSIVYPGWADQMETVDSTAAELERIYKQTFEALCGAKIDFDYGDEDFIRRFARVEVDNDKTILRIGEASYESVLVTGMLTMRSTTLNVLKEFSNKGGKLIFAGDIPAYVGVINNSSVKELPAKFLTLKEAVSEIKKHAIVHVTDSKGENISDIYVQVRQNGEDTIIMLLNINREKSYPASHISLGCKGVVEHWNARNGEVTLLEMNNGKIIGDFAPSGELLLVVTNKDNNRPLENKKQIIRCISAGHTFNYRLHEPNVCVLDMVDYKIDNNNWVSGQEILKADRQIRDRFDLSHRGGRMIQPWFQGKLDHPELCDLTVKYSFTVDAIPENLTLVCETPEEFIIKINGSNTTTLTDGYWVDTCFKLLSVDTQILKKGTNEITFATRFREDINLEAIYLLGDFGVNLVNNAPVLSELPDKLTIGSIVTQGFPFYGAGISYFIKLPECKDSELMTLSTEHFEAACLKVIGSAENKLIFTQPYSADVTQMAGETIELAYILTRRNTFGPLHMPYKKSFWYGPDAFVTDGDDFKTEYQLLPQGMTDEVLINYLK